MKENFDNLRINCIPFIFPFHLSIRIPSNCIPFGLLQRKTFFSEGCINFKMLPLKLVRPS